MARVIDDTTFIDFGESILPTDPAAYIFDNASLVNGKFIFDGPGSATCILPSSALTHVTSVMQLQVLCSSSAPNMSRGTHIVVSAVTNAGRHYYNDCNISFDEDDAYITEVDLVSSDISALTFTIVATEACEMPLVEFKPQTKDSTDEALDDLYAALQSMLYDRNQTEIAIEQEGQVIGEIGASLSKRADMQGHLLIKCFATERTYMHIRIYCDDIEQSYCPMIVLLDEGYNEIGLPHAYIAIQAGVHTFTVTAQVTNGSAVIPVHGVMYTIDSGYMAARLSDPGVDVCDMAIRQLPDDPTPSELWAVGLDEENGTLVAKKTPFDISSGSAAWEAVYVFEDCIDGSIEFDGVWTRRTGDIHYTLETEASPCIATIDTEHKLKVYFDGPQSHATDIASDVDAVAMIRGYSSQVFDEHDQGLIIAWVSDGNVYYRQYMPVEGIHIWLPAVQLTDTDDAIDVSLHRLNDFRVGFLVQTEDSNIWYITDRMYVGQAVPAEVINAKISGQVYFNNPANDSPIFNPIIAQSELPEGDVPPQDTFYIEFTNLDHIKITQGSTVEWLKGLTVKVNNVTRTDYRATVDGMRITIVFNAPLSGTITMAVTAAMFNNILLYDAEGCCAFCTIATTTYSWTVQSRISVQNAEQVTAAITGTCTFENIELMHYVETVPEAVAASFTGTAEFTNVELTHLTQQLSENVSAEVTGTALFEDIQTGDIPV